jgi:hypothetical protein
MAWPKGKGREGNKISGLRRKKQTPENEERDGSGKIERKPIKRETRDTKYEARRDSLSSSPGRRA